MSQSPVMQPPPFVQPESPPGPNIVMATIGAAGGAFIGALIWAAIEYFTNYRVGYVAILIGILAGGGAVALGRGSGPQVAIISALAGLAGIIGGCYLAFVIALHSDRTRDEVMVELRSNPQFAMLSTDELRKIADEAMAEIRQNMTFLDYLADDGSSLAFLALFGGIGLFTGYRIGNGKQA